MAGLNPISTIIEGFGSAAPILRVAAEETGLIQSEQDIARDALRDQQDFALTQLQQQQALNLRLAEQNTEQERQRLAEQTRQDNEARQAALRRAVARQRVQFGASGVGSNGGSSQAVLLGLFDESEEDQENRQRLDNLRNNALDQDLSQVRARNVFESTQAAQRNQLALSTRFGN